jgi:hypothetical protein
MPAPPWTAEDEATLRRLHGEGKALHSIAREMGRSKATISKYAEQYGLSWSRERTSAAAQAVVIDNKARRVRAVARMYDRIEHLQDRLDTAAAQGWKTVLKGENGVDQARVLDFVPTPDERNIADTLSRYVASLTKLEDRDAGDKPNAVRDLLTGLANSLGITDGP